MNYLIIVNLDTKYTYTIVYKVNLAKYTQYSRINAHIEWNIMHILKYILETRSRLSKKIYTKYYTAWQRYTFVPVVVVIFLRRNIAI